MNFTENSDEITIRYVPVREWIIGGILTFFSAVLCLFLLYAFFVAPRGYYESLFGKGVDLISVLIVAAVFICFLFEIKAIRASLTTVNINQKNGSVDILYQRIFGKRRKRYYFLQIEKFKSYKGKVNFSPTYFLALVLANRKTIKLKIPIGENKNDIVKLIKKLNKFIKAKRVSEID